MHKAVELILRAEKGDSLSPLYRRLSGAFPDLKDSIQLERAKPPFIGSGDPIVTKLTVGLEIDDYNAEHEKNVEKIVEYIVSCGYPRDKVDLTTYEKE